MTLASWNRSGTVACGAALLLLACLPLLSTGCSKSRPTVQQSIASQARTTVELCPPGSPEQFRRHKFDELGREFQTEITYRDKSTGIEFRNPNTGALIEFKRTHPDSATLSRYCRYVNGQLVFEELYHQSGKLQQRRQWHSNGDRELQRFTQDGVSELLKVLVRKDGSGELIDRLEDWGTGRIKGIQYQYQWESNGDFVRDQYDFINGKTLFTRCHCQGNTLVVSLYRTDGTVQFRQYHKPVNSSDPNRRPSTPPWAVEKVEVLDWDGKTVEKVFYFDGTLYQTIPDAVHFPVSGGGKLVVETRAGAIRQNGERDIEVTAEKVYDAAGKLTSQKTSTTIEENQLRPWQPHVEPVHNLPRNLRSLVEAYFRR